jgi:hypothetical protein
MDSRLANIKTVKEIDSQFVKAHATPEELALVEFRKKKTEKEFKFPDIRYKYHKPKELLVSLTDVINDIITFNPNRIYVGGNEMWFEFVTTTKVDQVAKLQAKWRREWNKHQKSIQQEHTKKLKESQEYKEYLKLKRKFENAKLS